MNIEEKIKEELSKEIIDWKRHSERRFYFSVMPENITKVVKLLFNELNLRFITATGTDTPEGIEILYHFSDDKSGKVFSARVLIINKKNPEIDSITPLICGAEWIEREIWELLGVKFRRHPNLKHLLLIEDWPEGEYPLRKKD
ncbi:MAG: NADH-quinone oxidoreductase subunit C [Candidatus Omnitrophica bacterium]|nr:NADH-quinone oxidoreductase subunit C [Candidatus Omnitrophota bacterium]